MNKFSVSLIVTTYNRPDALELVLMSIKNQSVLPTEVIIADDGSTEETAILISNYQRDYPIPLVHCWQDDIGFRLSRSRNIAIARAMGEYLIMIDGDMVLHHHFVRDHVAAAKKNQFIQGRRVILTAAETENALKEKRTTFNIFSSGVKNKINALCSPILSKLFSGLFSKHDHTSVRGCNMAFWRIDVLKINGFNENFTGWGREDSEFVVRLLNIHIHRKDLRFGGVAYHLYHNESSQHNLYTNDHLLELAISEKTTYCDLGLSAHLEDRDRNII